MGPLFSGGAVRLGVEEQGWEWQVTGIWCLSF